MTGLGEDMKRHLAIVAYAALAWHAGLVAAEPIPKIEQGIYMPAPPFEKIKTAIYVRERERALLPLIEDASTSIAEFLLDIFAYGSGIRSDMPHVLPEARDSLRLPPPASIARPANTQRRFIHSTVYCWRSDNPAQLRFLIEWADPATSARHTDSYVFVRRGATWYFERHDTIAPWAWTQNQRYFQRMCPDEN